MLTPTSLAVATNRSVARHAMWQARPHRCNALPRGSSSAALETGRHPRGVRHRWASRTAVDTGRSGARRQTMTRTCPGLGAPEPVGGPGQSKQITRMDGAVGSTSCASGGRPALRCAGCCRRGGDGAVTSAFVTGNGRFVGVVYIARPRSVRTRFGCSSFQSTPFPHPQTTRKWRFPRVFSTTGTLPST